MSIIGKKLGNAKSICMTGKFWSIMDTGLRLWLTIMKVTHYAY